MNFYQIINYSVSHLRKCCPDQLGTSEKSCPVKPTERLPTWFYRDGHPRLKRLRAGKLRSVVDVHAQVVANVVGAVPSRSLAWTKWTTWTLHYEEFSVTVDFNFSVEIKVVVTANVFSCIAEETFQISVPLINMETLTQLPPQSCCRLTKLDGSKMNWLQRCDCGRYI